MLRSSTISNENDEERVVPSMGTVTAPLKTGAKKLVDAWRVRAWVRKKHSVDDVWQMLQLKGDLDEIIANPKLELLDTYVKLFNKKYKQEESVVGMLSLRYGDDNVMMTLLKARQVDNHGIAAKLQFMQLKEWFIKGKSVNDVFNILKIGDDGPKFMENPKLRLLDEYIGLFNFKNPHEKTDYFTALTNGFGGEGQFVIVLSKATENPTMGAQALDYQEHLFDMWIKSGVKPENFIKRIYNVDEKKLAVDSDEKHIANLFKKFYDEDLGLDQIPRVIDPRW
ncbi:RxLR effector protein [Phytophthora megakarya]|uniref:RxLR effector protein n=1 Tax=Phytophthora megakarya TaxID=4795 RepID=A0A225VEU4_9STRA|nr:RxLR effector protein [Phytophthora megakarya]